MAKWHHIKQVKNNLSFLSYCIPSLLDRD